MQALIILLTLPIQDCSYYLCFIFFYIFSSSDLVSKDKTFNTRQEKEPLVVDPLGLFRVLPHSPAKKVVCSIIIVIITWLFFFAFWILLVSFVPPGYQFPDASNPTAVTGTPAPPATVSTILHNQSRVLPCEFYFTNPIWAMSIHICARLGTQKTTITNTNKRWHRMWHRLALGEIS